MVTYGLKNSKRGYIRSNIRTWWWCGGLSDGSVHIDVGVGEVPVELHMLCTACLGTLPTCAFFGLLWASCQAQSYSTCLLHLVFFYSSSSTRLHLTITSLSFPIICQFILSLTSYTVYRYYTTCLLYILKFN